MHPNEKLLERFYQAFQKRDHATMAACYRPDAVFGDPVFPRLVGPEIGAMWRMLCTRGEDLVLTFDGIEADDAKGSARWEAVYTFRATGRKVTNRIESRFVFRDGAIERQDDAFDFFRWARMALGAPGYLLGWTGWLRRKVRRQADAELRRFVAKEAAQAAPRSA